VGFGAGVGDGVPIGGAEEPGEFTTPPPPQAANSSALVATVEFKKIDFARLFEVPTAISHPHVAVCGFPAGGTAIVVEAAPTREPEVGNLQRDRRERL
jgi:hypothetical protein